METEQAALGADDYRMLQGMLLSSDASVRAQGQGLAKKLTPSEQQEFFDFQKQATKGRDEQSQRADSAIVGGVPVIGSVTPEDALMVGAVGRGVQAAVTAPGVANRAVAGAKAVAAAAAPGVKYEATKYLLERMGVPTPLAVGAAIAVSGYRHGAPAAAAEGEALAPEMQRRDVSAPVRPGDLTDAQFVDRVKNGTGAPTPKTPVYAPRPVPGSVEPPASPAVAPAPQGPPAASTAAPPPIVESAPSAPPAPKPTLLAAEAKEYMKLIKAGKTHQQAMEAIQAQRDFAARFGLPTNEAVRTSVADRNATGRWEE